MDNKRTHRAYKAKDKPYTKALGICDKTPVKLANVHEATTEAIADKADIISRKNGIETIIFHQPAPTR